MKVSLPEIDLDRCDGCGNCVEQCPTGVVEIKDGKATIVRPEECSYCTECESFCPQEAIRCPFEIILLKAQPKARSEDRQER